MNLMQPTGAHDASCKEKPPVSHARAGTTNSSTAVALSERTSTYKR